MNSPSEDEGRIQETFVAPTCMQEDGDETDECPICYQDYVYKIELPGCKHKFCFLCIKGVALRHGLCPLCRKRIPLSVFQDPVLTVITDQRTSAPACSGSKERTDRERNTAKKKNANSVQWFYGARNGGWWRYEWRHENEIEEAYQRDSHQTKILIAGRMYCIDFDHMCQIRKGNRMGKYVRAIKRVEDMDPSWGSEVRGIAGLRTLTEPCTQNVPRVAASVIAQINTVDLKQQ